MSLISYFLSFYIFSSRFFSRSINNERQRRADEPRGVRVVQAPEEEVSRELRHGAALPTAPDGPVPSSAQDLRHRQRDEDDQGPGFRGTAGGDQVVYLGGEGVGPRPGPRALPGGGKVAGQDQVPGGREGAARGCHPKHAASTFIAMGQWRGEFQPRQRDVNGGIIGQECE